jgi:hypothetical protein
MIRRVVPFLAVVCAACSSLPITRGEPTYDERGSVAPEDGGDNGHRDVDELRKAMAEARAAVPSSPADAPPRDDAARRVWETALEAGGRRVVISREARSLWLIDDDGVAFRAPVAVGKQEPFEYRGKRYDF